MVAFTEERFNTEIRYGVSGGPEFSTDVLTVTSGAEQRNSNWKDSRGKWTLADDVYNKKEMNYLISFFRNRKGRAGGFRFKDWSDWTCVYNKDDNYIEGVVVVDPAYPTQLRMAKLYKDENGSTTRIIVKPVPGTVQFWLPLEVPTIDTLTGALVFGEPQSGSVDYLTGKVSGVNANWRWTGEFDVPARFDVDQFNSTFEGYREADGESLYSISSVTIVELNLIPPQAIVPEGTTP